MECQKMTDYIKADEALDVLNELVNRFKEWEAPEGADLIESVIDFLKSYKVSLEDILKAAETCRLVDALKERSDVVKTTYVEPYDIAKFNVEGPAVVLEVID